VKLSFTKGELTAIDGVPGSPVQNIQKLQELTASYAIGRDIHVGDTIIGIKGRVGFEAAAPLVILKAHHLLEKHTLSKWQQFQKEQLGNFYGMLLHEGNYLDEVMRNIEAFLTDTQKNVSGEVFVTLHPYRFELNGIHSQNDLMAVSFGSYGEMNKAWTANDAKGFIKILSNPAKIATQVNKNHD
jgi:argininosuccinate synthase